MSSSDPFRYLCDDAVLDAAVRGQLDIELIGAVGWCALHSVRVRRQLAAFQLDPTMETADAEQWSRLSFAEPPPRDTPIPRGGVCDFVARSTGRVAPTPVVVLTQDGGRTCVVALGDALPPAVPGSRPASEVPTGLESPLPVAAYAWTRRWVETDCLTETYASMASDRVDAVEDAAQVAGTRDFSVVERHVERLLSWYGVAAIRAQVIDFDAVFRAASTRVTTPQAATSLAAADFSDQRREGLRAHERTDWALLAPPAAFEEYSSEWPDGVSYRLRVARDGRELIIGYWTSTPVVLDAVEIFSPEGRTAAFYALHLGDRWISRSEIGTDGRAVVRFRRDDAVLDIAVDGRRSEDP